MVYYETDVLDKECMKQHEEVYKYFGKCAVTVYTGTTFYFDTLCLNTVQKKFSGTTINDKQMEFKKSAVVCIESF